jgi:hypothetical protein
MNKYNGNFGKIGRRDEKKCIDSSNFLMVCVGILSVVVTGLYLKYKLTPIDAPVVFEERAELLSVEDIESQYNIQVLMPTPLQLQEWCARKGASIEIDGELGNDTEYWMNWVYCMQQAAEHNYIEEKEFNLWD